jgi:hypothetical protein
MNMSLFEHFSKLQAFIWKPGSGSGSASNEKYDPYPHQNDKQDLDPDLQKSGKQDPDPQHWFYGT